MASLVRVPLALHETILRLQEKANSTVIKSHFKLRIFLDSEIVENEYDPA